MAASQSYFEQSFCFIRRLDLARLRPTEGQNADFHNTKSLAGFGDKIKGLYKKPQDYPNRGQPCENRIERLLWNREAGRGCSESELTTVHHGASATDGTATMAETELDIDHKDVLADLLFAEFLENGGFLGTPTQILGAKTFFVEFYLEAVSKKSKHLHQAKTSSISSMWHALGNLNLQDSGHYSSF